MFDRKIYEAMLRWKKEYAPHYALFLKGARRVGKTALALKLGKEAYKSYILVRFDQADEDIKRLLVNELRDLDTLFSALSLIYQTPLFARESLIIFDDIHLFPPARQALKTLLEDGRYDYLETGSLAGITKRSKEYLIPSEEYALEVLPMDFEEFLWANEDRMTMPAIRQHIESMKPMGAIHQPIMKKFREYMLVGGMPEAVAAFVKTKDFGKADFFKQQIISLYKSDIEDQNDANSDFAGRLFDHIHSELYKRDKRFIISHIDPSARLQRCQGTIRWLDDAMIISRARRAEAPSAASRLCASGKAFKCFMMDTGLLVSLAFRNRPFLENELYKDILLDKMHTHEGMLLENVIAQCLRANGHDLFFYTERNSETRKKIMKIDFLIRRDQKIVPIAVHSGGSHYIKSLTKFHEKFWKLASDGIILHHGELKREGNISYLPYYMASVL